MSIINILSQKPAVITLLNAMAEVVIPGDSDFCRHFNIEREGDQSKAEVKVFVNGVEVPFVEALQEAVDVVFQRINDEVKARALELIKERPLLNNLYTELEAAERRIRQALDALEDDQ